MRNESARLGERIENIVAFSVYFYGSRQLDMRDYALCKIHVSISSTIIVFSIGWHVSQNMAFAVKYVVCFQHVPTASWYEVCVLVVVGQLALQALAHLCSRHHLQTPHTGTITCLSLCTSVVHLCVIRSPVGKGSLAARTVLCRCGMFLHMFIML